MHLWNRWWHQGSLMLFTFWKMVWIFYRIVMSSIYDQRWFQQRLEGLPWDSTWYPSWPVEELYVWETPIYKSLQGRLAHTCGLWGRLGFLQHHHGVTSSACQWHSHQPLLYLVISVTFKWSEHKLLFVGGKHLVFIRCIYLVPFSCWIFCRVRLL